MGKLYIGCHFLFIIVLTLHTDLQLYLFVLQVSVLSCFFDCERYIMTSSCGLVVMNLLSKTIHEKWKWKWCIMIAGRSIARIKVVPAIAVRPLRASQYSKV